MADDDDTSAGLTSGTRPAARRRASRSAGPPKEAQADTATVDTALPDGAEAVEEAGETVETVETRDVPARSRRGLAAWIVAGVLIVALVGSAVWLLIERNAADERDAQRNAYVQTARQTVINLTTIKPDTAKEDVDRILAGASGEFKSEFDGREDPFVSVVQEAGVTTVGKILEAGLESEDGNSAKVLVAARADVSTPDGTQNGPRDFRMRVTVTDDGGTMTASKVEFVP